MSAICGFLQFSGTFRCDVLCGKMLHAQSAYGPHHHGLRQEKNVAFGRALFRLLPEDLFDVQPLGSTDKRFLLVADLRIDNRLEILCNLGITPSGAAGLSDAAVLLKAYERWSLGVLDRLVGDFSFALWDSAEERLIIARDPTGQRPLHYHQGAGFFAFSSMPHGLHALDMFPKVADQRRLAEFLGDIVVPTGFSSFFKYIDRLPSGHYLTVTQTGIETRRYWDPPRRQLELPSWSQYVEAFREQLDQATASRLRSLNGTVAAHLSSGYDSSAVSATAAKLLRPEGKKLVAFTAAPRLGFDGAVPRGRIADESGVAASTAALHSNIEHIVVRPGGADALTVADRVHPLMQQPVGHACNNIWWTSINDAARQRDVSVMLTGESGNMTISAGGLAQLADLVSAGRWLRWLQEARSVTASDWASWRGVLGNSFGPWFPRPIWRLLSSQLLNSSPKRRAFLLSPHWAEEVDRATRTSGREIRPPRNSYRFRLEALQRADFGNQRKGVLAGWGFEERDPTSDRRLIEFCLALPIEKLLVDGVRRPLARAALADRLPASVLEAKLRGYQTADWYERISLANLKREVQRVKRSPDARALLDFDQIEATLKQWPTENLASLWVIADIRGALLRALAAVRFLNSVSGEANRST